MDTIFGDQGLLAQKLPGYESRQGQGKMAEAVFNLLVEASAVDPESREQADFLIIEAETGLGKTLAYLIPAALSGRKVVVSTNTRNLQDQIIKREIPFIQEHIDPHIQALCVKGRQNYLCLYRWLQNYNEQQTSLVADDRQQQIHQWLAETEYGDRAELPWLSAGSSLWQKINCQSHFCLGGDCPEHGRCFLNKLRRDAARCRILIVNHHLLFSDLAVRQSGYGEVLPRYEAVVFDEAHHLENVATTFFGRSFSRFQVIDLIADIEREIQTSAHYESISPKTAALKGALGNFMKSFPAETGRFPMEHDQENKAEIITAVNVLMDNLEKLADILDKAGSRDMALEQYAERCKELAENLNITSACFFDESSAQGGQHTFWLERTERNLSLHATPIDVSKELQSTLYKAVSACIFTSATLKTGNNFDYFAKRLGLPEQADSLSFASPFDYANKTLLYIPGADFPEPSAPSYAKACHEQIEHLVLCSRGRALVLFTSFRAMESAYHALEDRLPFPLLMQGEAPRHALLDEFTRNTESLLFGVSSFWEGVDIPGDSLSMLIIDKLPFEVPSDPVIMARMNNIKQNGANPFFTFQVPRAIISLRQGAGRLMRKSSDSGVIAILDTRLYSKGYGKRFLQSLPESPVTRDFNQVANFYNDHV